jgi:hypothetical protein
MLWVLPKAQPIASGKAMARPRPLNHAEYVEYRNLAVLTKKERGATGHQRYLDLYFRYMLFLDKRR